MTEESKATGPVPKRRGWLRKLAWACGVGFVLLLVFYFVATSSMFLQGVVLPQVGKAMHASVTVDSIAVSPFSSIDLRNLKVQPVGAEPLLTVQEVRARYSLWAMIGGQIKVSEISVVSPTLSIVEHPDGSKNTDALADDQPVSEKKSESKSTKPLQIDIGKITVTAAVFRTVKNYASGASDVAEVSNLNLEISGVKNGQTGKLALSAGVKVDNHPPAPGTNGLLRATLTSDLEFTLTQDLAPASFKGGTRFEVAQAGGGLADFSQLAVNLDTEATAAEIKQIAVSFKRDRQLLGEVRVSGPYQLATKEGRLDVEVRSIDKQVLNLVGSHSGLDFGPTTINSTNRLYFSRAGLVITAVGSVNVAKFQVRRDGVATPSVDARVAYDLGINSAEGSIRVTNLTVTATQKENRLLTGGLTSPLGLSWKGEVGMGMGDSAWTLQLTNLNLADWQALTGDAGPKGMVNARVNLTSHNEGQSFGVDIATRIDDLSVPAGSNQNTRVTVDFKAQALSQNFSEFSLESCRLQVLNQGQSLVSLTASGKSSTPNQSADLQFRVQAGVGQLLQVLGLSDSAATGGMLDLQGKATRKQDERNIAGTFKLDDLTAKVGGSDFQRFGLAADFDLGMEQDSVDRKFIGGLTQAGKSGGRFSIGGKHSLTAGATDLTVDLEDFNQDGLRPFIEPALGGKKLVTLAINGKAALQTNPQGDASIKTGLQIANLVVKDPRTQVSAAPLEAKMQIEMAMRQHVAELNKFQITLSPTARAKNELDLTGRVDMSRSNAITGNLKLTADSLDLTPYYDLLAGGSKSNAATTATAPAAPEKSTEEPAAMKLPLQNFSFSADIGRLYLREIEVTRFQTLVKIDGGHVLVGYPFQLALNDGPVRAKVDLDLGVPGYKYDVNFSATKIPQEPLVNSFAPERKGQIKGTFTGNVGIKGAGTTDANLKKNLDGNFSVLSTNINLSITNVHSRFVNIIVNAIIGLPELISGAGFKARGGWLDEFEAQPINIISIKGTAGQGQVTLQEATIRSTAFDVGAKGKIGLENVFTNSTIRVPVTVALNYSLANQIGLVAADTPTNTVYVSLPDFLTVNGTIGQPSQEINKLGLLKLVAKTGGGLGKNIGKALGTSGNSVGGTVGNKAKSIFNVLDKLTGPKTNTPPASP